MRKLKFNVNEQMIEKDGSCDFSGIVSGTSGYLYACFNFSREWSGMGKVAEFRRYETSECFPALISNSMCEIPKEVLAGKRFCVNVVGKNGDKILTTNKCFVNQEV